MPKEQEINIPAPVRNTVQFNTDLDVLKWADIAEDIAPQGIHLQTKELIDQEFIILNCKQYVSALNDQEYAYHIVGSLTKGNKLFNTTIGGGQPMEILDALVKAKIQNPVKFILRWVEGGTYGGYYLFE